MTRFCCIRDGEGIIDKHVILSCLTVIFCEKSAENKIMGTAAEVSPSCIYPSSILKKCCKLRQKQTPWKLPLWIYSVVYPSFLPSTEAIKDILLYSLLVPPLEMIPQQPRVSLIHQRKIHSGCDHFILTSCYLFYFIHQFSLLLSWRVLSCERAQFSASMMVTCSHFVIFRSKDLYKRILPTQNTAYKWVKGTMGRIFVSFSVNIVVSIP